MHEKHFWAFAKITTRSSNQSAQVFQKICMQYLNKAAYKLLQQLVIIKLRVTIHQEFFLSLINNFSIPIK